MIRTIADIPRGLQVIGLLGSVAALWLSLVFGGALAPMHGVIALLAVGLDLNALRVRPSRAIILACAKLLIAWLLTLLIRGGAPRFEPPLIPPTIGLDVLILSAFPSLAGAILRKMS